MTSQTFNAKMLEIFRYQVENNTVYKKYCDLLKIESSAVKDHLDIPYLPIQFFKTHVVNCQVDHEIVFSSSGTSGSIPSRHFVADLSIYRESFTRGFSAFIGDPSDLTILCLLPSYMEREGSSLIYMAEDLVKKAREGSGFFLNDHQALHDQLLELKNTGAPCVLIGVSFALLDFIEKFSIQYPDLMVMETGGMKGRREEITREELHAKLRAGFGVKNVWSEYGMTELLSQAYSTGEGLFNTPPWMKFVVRDITDPGNVSQSGRGGLNIIDLANVHSCSFIATDDMANITADGVEILGRIDNSDVRGCNLMVAE